LLVNASDEEQDFLSVQGRNPNNPSCVVLEVLRIRSEEIVAINSGLTFVDSPSNPTANIRSEEIERPVDSQEEEFRQRIRVLLKDSESIRDQLNVARQEYRARFQELSARLLSQTSTWRSLRITKENLRSRFQRFNESAMN